MIYSISSPRNSEITARSTLDWRAWWREQALIDGTDWTSLHRQHVEAWRRLRSLAESNGAAL
jgi:hypothetical protein